MTNSGLAAHSMVLTFFFAAAALALVALVWRDRRRFLYWRVMAPQGRADTILHISLVGVLGIAGYHRAIATYNFLLDVWANPNTPLSALFYLPLHLAAMAGVLWWLCIELCGSTCGGRTWLVLMAVGAALGGATFILDGGLA